MWFGSQDRDRVMEGAPFRLVHLFTSRDQRLGNVGLIKPNFEVSGFLKDHRTSEGLVPFQKLSIYGSGTVRLTASILHHESLQNWPPPLESEPGGFGWLTRLQEL